MGDRPILFSGQMVRALIDGKKTQTRRILKPKKHACLLSGGWTDDHILDPGNREWLERYYRWRVGDRLWVRENFWIVEIEDGGIGNPFLVYDEEWSTGPGAKEPRPVALRDGFGMGKWGHHSSIHMPRAASRLTLTVTDVRVQRLQAISEEDAKAEGAEPAVAGRGDDGPIKTYRTGFVGVWQKINGNWLDNPWVAAVSFRVAQHNIDSPLLLAHSCIQGPPAREARHHHLVKETTLSEIPRCSFNTDQRCLKGAGCAAHGIECMRRGAAFSFTMGTTPDLDKLVQELDDLLSITKAPMSRDIIERAAAALTAVRGRVKELEERLEMNHAWRLVDGKMTRVPVEPGSIPDGIDCRDETIRQQDRIIDELRARIAELGRK